MDDVPDAIAKIHEKLRSSEILYESGQYGDSISISYYVMFTSANSYFI